MLVHIPKNSNMMYTKENFEFYICHNSYVNFVVVPYMFFMNFDRYIQSEIFTAFTFNGNEDI